MRTLTLLLIVLLLGAPASAQTPSHRHLRVCSQNLFRFNEKPAKRNEQRDYLISRITHAECDVVAVQEIIGSNKREADATLGLLARAWKSEIGEEVDTILGDSLDNYIRNGFLVRRSAGRIHDVENFLNEPLPRLQPLGPAGRFQRSPVVLVLDAPERRFWIMNIHLKSRSRGFKDASGTDFELLRMEMAEAVRDIVLREEKTQPPGTVFIITGDRNGDLVHAASRILSGERELSDFTRGGPCRLTEDEHPECGLTPGRRPDFIGLFERRRALFPEDYRGGSYTYKGRQELLDEMFIRPNQIDLVSRDGGRLNIGFEGQFYKGSDHKLIWADFSF